MIFDKSIALVMEVIKNRIPQLLYANGCEKWFDKLEIFKELNYNIDMDQFNEILLYLEVYDIIKTRNNSISLTLDGRRMIEKNIYENHSGSDWSEMCKKYNLNK
jgi:predicted transcriptional regulator